MKDTARIFETLDSYFTATRKSSKANILTVAMATTKLTATTLEAAVLEARQIANDEVGTVAVHYVMNGTSSHMKTVRASKQAVADHTAWLAKRA